MLYGQTLSHRIDSLLYLRIPDTTGPGAVFMVAKKGKIVYRKAVGKANLELDVNMQTGNVFQIGSMTKQFTAVAILMLEEQGKLQLTDPVSKYVPGYPAGDKITIHHLLTHTSGIKDFTAMKSLSSIAQKEMSPEAMVNFFKDEPADFSPGERFSYNNSGYVLLGYIIELVSGNTYENFIQHNIFDKAGMKNSGYASDRKVIRNRAYGYHKKEHGYVNKNIISFSVPFSSGALMSTANDMFLWQTALNKNLLLNANSTQKLFTSYTLAGGKPVYYGYGWHLRDINGTASREHGGSVFGFKSMGVYIPEKDIYVIGLSNCDCISPTELTREIAGLTLKAE
ncbi:serine hydrolase domain-containing protein [Terrimonas rubra]|uniref:Serine hydrolase domain-containing protein n=1 Tax=Terrimonas rubra TaxID=1035890 RepID=A0ABW6AD20_9BACT